MIASDETCAEPGREHEALLQRCESLQRQCADHRQAKEELNEFFVNSLDLLCVAGMDGYFKRLNPAWTRQLGWSIDELLSRPFDEFVHPNDRAATDSRLKSLATGVETVLFENRYLDSEGSHHWLQWNARPDLKRQLIYATARDVTEQKILEREFLEICDRERERLGRELHDGLCQTLAGIAALTATLSKGIPPDSELEDCAAKASEIATLIEDAIREARDLSRGLQAKELCNTGLDGALSTLSSNVDRLFQVRCEYRGCHSFPKINPDIEAHLFRIAQEALSNAVSHGKASRIALQLKYRSGRGILSILDDGTGLPDHSASSEGMGLRTMQYRARLLGAQLRLQSSAGQGTRITCRFSTTRCPDFTRCLDFSVSP